MEWSLQVSGGGDWLEVTPTTGTTPSTLYVSVADFSVKVPGTHQATIVVTSEEEPGSSELITVTVVAVEQLHRVILPAIYHNR
jgi:hypothetical protein